MYGLALDTDLSFLEGRQLLQVCVGVNEVILNFDGDVRLTLLSDFGVAASGGEVTDHQDPMTGAISVFALLHDTIDRAEVTAEGKRLVLTFRSGSRLELIDTSDQYESFWISNGAREIIV